MFNVLAKDNQQVIREILESSDVPSADIIARSYDEQILQKVRGLYQSCVDEDTLDDIDSEPLINFIEVLKKLFRGESTEISTVGRDKYEGLTAAVAFLHSRGMYIHLHL